MPQQQFVNTFDIRALKKGENENYATANKELLRIIWIREGSGTMYVDMCACPIDSDTIYCIRPGQLIRFEPTAEAEGHTISFSADFLAMDGNHPELFSPLFPFFVIKVQSALDTEMRDIVEKMIRELSGVYPWKDEILRGLLKIFLVYLNRHQDESRQQLLHQPGLVAKFFILLEKNFASWKMVSDYAQVLSVTANYLNETVKKTSGFPASYHIRQRIILEAKRKAAYVRMSMKEIAYELGFDDLSHFSKYFKKASGISFTDFKKGISQQFIFSPEFITPKKIV